MAKVNDWDQIPLHLQDWDLDDTSEIIQQLTKLTASDIFKSHSTYQVSVGYAARGSHWKFLKQLAQTGLRVTTTASCMKRNICTDLVNLFQESDFEAIQELLDTNRDLLKARSGNSLITSLLYYSCTPKCLEFVIDRQKEVNECEYADVINGHDWHGFTPLIAVVLAGNLPCVQRLLERGAKVDLPSSLLGLELNRPEIGINFIEENVSFKENMFFGHSKTALMYAACIKSLESIKILLKFKPDLKRVCYKGMNALSYAAIAPSLQCLSLLLKTSLEVDGYGKMVKNRGVNGISSNVGTKSGFIFALSETSFNFNEKTNSTPKQDVYVSQTTNFRFLNTATGFYQATDELTLLKDVMIKKVRVLSDTPTCVERTLCEAALPFGVIGGDLQCVELLLNYCVDLNSTNCSTKTALMLAAEGGKVDLVELLLKNWANVNLSFERNNKETALMLASKNGHVKCVNLLLHFNARKEAVNSYNETALMYACRNGRKDCLELLLEHKANIEAENEKGQTPLIIAACAGKYECVQKLLQFNARIDKEDVHKMSAPTYAVENCHTKCLEVLLQSLIEKEDLEKLGQVAHSSIGISESAKTTKKEEMVMETEEPIKTITTLAEELLPLAITSRNKKCVELLVPHCMDFGRIKKLGDKSALMLCAERGNVNLVNVMIKHCGNINTGSRATALTCATKAGKYECVKLLLEHGANPDIEIYRGRTAAIIAAKAGNEACLKLLLEHGANPNHISRRGKTALKSAATKKHSECLKLLIKHGANVNQRTGMWTPDDQTYQQIRTYFSAIMCAVLTKNNVKCLKILSDAGGKLDIVELYSNLIGKLWVDTFLEHLENLQFLLEKGNVFMSREINACDERVRCNLDTWSKFTSVQLLMEHDVFDWKCWCSASYFEEILFIAVGAGVFPRKIFYRGGLYSPLQYAFLNNEESAVLYMLSNLYFSIDDYKAITSDTAFTTKLMTEMKSPTLTSLLLPLMIQPWSIQTLSLLTISTALSRNGSPKGRISQVDSLPIPEKFKTVLKFKGGYSRLCISEWKNIGYDPAKILSPLKQLYCVPNELTQCDEDCICMGFGLRSTTE